MNNENISKQTGINQVSTNNSKWLENAKKCVLNAAAGVDSFTSEQARKWVPIAPNHPNAWGALFNSLARTKKIKRLGFTQSGFTGSHSRIVGVWKISNN